MTVVAKGRSPDLRIITLAPGLEPVDFRLQKGRTVRIRVIDNKSKPLAGVRIVADTWREHRSLAHLGVPRETDEDGRWVWDSAPEDAVLFDVLKQGYADIRKRGLLPQEEEHLITLREELPPMEVSGRVVDAKTHRPIESFRVIPGHALPNSTFAAWQRKSARLGKDGQYSIRLAEPFSHYSVRVEALGYLPSVSAVFERSERTATFDFELAKGVEVTGKVLLPDGTPLEGAEALLFSPHRRPYLKNGRIQHDSRSDWVIAKTAPDGGFSLAPWTKRYTLLVIDWEAACWRSPSRNP